MLEILPAHNRRRWFILILGSVFYLCSHSYVFGVTVTVAFDIVVNIFSLMLGKDPKSRPAASIIAFDCFLRAITIWIGVTINAFCAYAFDLSFLYGLQWLYFAVVAFVYWYLRLVDILVGGLYYVDYVFGLAALGILAFFMDFVAFGEPYTFMTEMIYIVSVICLVAVSDTKIKWWAFFIFILFWAIAIVAGYFINKAIGKDFRYDLAHYFTKTPLL